MPPFIAHFKPSKIQRIVLILFVLCLTYAIWFHFSGSLKIVLLLATLCSGIFAWREPKLRMLSLEIDAKGRAALLINAQKYEAHLCSGSLISPYCYCLKWQLPEKIVYQWLFYDSADPESLRRLRVWAKFGQPEINRSDSHSV